MAARSICCYEEDIRILLHDNTKLEIIQNQFAKSSILKFELITDKKLLKRGEMLTNGYFVRYDEVQFRKLISNQLESVMYVLIIMNGIIYTLNYIIDNYHVSSYVPVTVTNKNILDEKLSAFWKNKGFEYIPDVERELSEEEIRFLPLLSENILQEDYCILFLHDMHIHPSLYEEKPTYTLSKSMYIAYYINLISQALKLDKE